MNPATWWTAASTIVTALATLALAAFAAVQVKTLLGQRQERERLAAARIGATGFLARRQVRSWLGEGAGSPDDLEEWAVNAVNGGAFSSHISRAEESVLEMLAYSSEASSAISGDTRTAAALFFNGTEMLNNFIAKPQPSGIAIADWVSLRNMAWQDLSLFVVRVDGLDSAGLLSEARRLRAERQAEFPAMDAYYKKMGSLLEALDRKEDS